MKYRGFFKMCGIAGIFNRNHSPVDPKLLVCMTRTLVHRGPDEEGYFVNADIAGSREHGGWSKLQLRTLRLASSAISTIAQFRLK